MEESVLLGTKPLVDSIRHFSRDPIGVFFRMSPLWVSYRLFLMFNLVPRAHMPFGQHQDTELWNNPFPETKILDFRLHRAYMAWFKWRLEIKLMWIRSTCNIQYALEKLGKWKSGFERTVVSKFKSKRTRGLWERACWLFQSSVSWCWPKGMWALGNEIALC